MSEAGVARAVQRIASDLVALASAVLEDDAVSTNAKVGRNTLSSSYLRQSLKSMVSERGQGNPVISVLFQHYVVYLEWSRPPKYGKQPPIGVLKDWAASNGIPTDTHTLWAISYAIWRDGHAGRPIFATLDGLADARFDERWADELFSGITEQLDTLFSKK